MKTLFPQGPAGSLESPTAGEPGIGPLPPPAQEEEVGPLGEYLARLEELWAPLQDRPLLAAAVIIVAAFVAAKLLDWIVVRGLKTWSRRTKSALDDDIIELCHGPLIKTVVLLGLGLVARILCRGDKILYLTESVLWTIGILVWTGFGLRFSTRLLYAASRRPDTYLHVEPRTLPLFTNTAKLVIVGLGVYFLFGAWSIDATGWLASAGIVGIAVGFAAKDTLSNLFAGVFIIADAPYKVGDYINLESGQRGEVKNIGLRSTRLLTRDDIEVTIPNAVMGNASIINESAGPSPKHRVRVKVGVAYGTDVDRVRVVLQEIAESAENICDDPEPRVRFRSFGESGLDFELLGWIPEPALRGRVIDALNTAVYKRFAQEGIEIPYPKRDLYLKEMPSDLRKPSGSAGSS